jgi:hypothetical protein
MNRNRKLNHEWTRIDAKVDLANPPQGGEGSSGSRWIRQSLPDHVILNTRWATADRRDPSCPEPIAFEEPND